MRLPTIYIPHGGGPWPFVETGFGAREDWAPLEAYLRALVTSLPERPRALLVVSAHWEEKQVTLMTAHHPTMLYDYSGFGPASYELKWPAPTALDLVPRVRALLEAAGIASGENPKRGYDHGTFVPMMLSVPNADIPVLQVSLLHSLDPEAHLALGRALAPLRDEGVLLIGSGSSFHNLREFGQPDAAAASREFDAWLGASVTLARAEREERLRNWKLAPSGLACHPREEHLLPLHVMAGAAGDDAASVPFRGDMLGCRIAAVQFGGC
jgi:aromatic ring-opening dioxygenase catalytic subunit (LigB family)